MIKNIYLYLCLAVVFVTMGSVYCLTHDPDNTLIDEVKPLVLNCLTECDLEEEDLNEENMNSCFKKCFLTNIGLLSENGEFDKEEVTKKIKLYTKNEEDAAKILEALEECFEGKIENNEERISIIFECFMYY